MTLRRTFLIFGLAISACTAVDEDQETEPTADDIDFARAGSIDCTRERGTGYVAGSPSTIELVRVDGKLAKLETADAYWVMREAALADGVNLIVVSGFRTMAEQRYLYGCYVNCSCNHCNLAARPGYSNHQSGRALDLNTSSGGVLRWMNRNGPRFGFQRTVSGEPWHWELLGQSPARGPCLGGGSTEVAILEPAPGPTGEATVLFKADANERVHHVRWIADGVYSLGVSEDASNGFQVRYTFSELGERRIEAVGYDEEDREVARSHFDLDVQGGGRVEGALEFTTPTDLGWYPNGVELKMTASPEIARVEYLAGPYSLGASSDVDGGFATRYVFSTLGYRALTAIGYDVEGTELARSSLLVRVMPGSEDGVGPSVRFYAKNGETHANGDPILVAGSDSIVKVRVTADGWDVGAADRTDVGFAITERFTTLGVRNLVATGVDAGGNDVARHEVRVTVR